MNKRGRWSLILAFDPRARGATPVERYQAGAEIYGYIVAGSNNSRNGSWDASLAAIQAMSADVGPAVRDRVERRISRFSATPKTSIISRCAVSTAP